MKIAIVEWWPRLCGAVNWAVHLATGPYVEHQVDLLTFSKSGRPLKPWAKVPGRWQVHAIDEIANVLNKYDLVILSDIVCRAPEMKHGDPSRWALIFEQLQRLTVPWTTMIHDGSYAGKESERMLATLRLPSFSGVLITTREREAIARIDKLDHGRHLRWVTYPYLPYATSLTGPVARPEDRTRELLFLGRLSTNKGQDVLLDLFTDLAVDVHLYGYCAYGKPSHGWLLWELATKHLGLTESAFPRATKPYDSPNIYKFYTGAWAVTNQAGSTFTYHGEYGPRFEGVDWAPRVALGLTNDGWKGTLEYATLDAIAHGCVAVVPEQQVEYASYKHLVTVPYRRCSFKVGKDSLRRAKSDWDRAAVLRQLDNLVYDRSDAELDLLSANQRAELMTKHNPYAVMSHILNGLRSAA